MSTCAAIREKIAAEPGLRLADLEVDAHLAGCEGCRRVARALPAVDRALQEIVRHGSAVPSFDRLAPAAAAAARSRRRVATARRRLPFAITGGIAAAAAFAGAVLLIGALERPGRLHVGERLPATSGGSMAVAASGAEVRVDAGEVQLVSGEQGDERFLLNTGSAAFRVPKLPRGHSLAVQTPDADVRVHGTRFHVTRDERGTTVRVTEGLVEVRPDGSDRQPTFLHPGESVFVEPLEAHRRGLHAAAQAALERGDYEKARGELSSLLATDPPPQLRAEALAMGASATAGLGDRHAAIAQYRDSLAALPPGETPLWADNAASYIATLLEGEDPRAAETAWRDYLRRFPEGTQAAAARARLARTRSGAAP